MAHCRVSKSLFVAGTQDMIDLDRDELYNIFGLEILIKMNAGNNEQLSLRSEPMKHLQSLDMNNGNTSSEIADVFHFMSIEQK